MKVILSSTVILMTCHCSQLSAQIKEKKVRLAASILGDAAASGTLSLELSNEGNAPVVAHELRLYQNLGWDSKVSELTSVTFGDMAYYDPKSYRLVKGQSITGSITIADVIDLSKTPDGTYEIQIVYNDAGVNYDKRQFGIGEFGDIGRIDSQPIYFAVHKGRLVTTSLTPINEVPIKPSVPLSWIIGIACLLMVLTVWWLTLRARGAHA